MWSGAAAWALAVLPVLVTAPLRCSLAPPRDDRVSAVQPKQEAPAQRVSSAPPPAPARGIALPDEVVVRAIAAGQPAFLRCWSRAQLVDPPDIAPKVRLHLELDAAGKVMAASSDTESPTLSRCLAVVARQLPFPAPGQPAVVDLPMIFQ
jgi:hypothetical protein